MLKKFAALFCALTVAFAFTSCEPNEPVEATKLSKPVLDVKINGADVTFVWKEVKNAASYVYTLNDGEEATTTELSAEFPALENGEYTFKVKACPAADSKEYAESDFASIIITVQALPEGWFTQTIETDPSYSYYAFYYTYKTLTELQSMYQGLFLTEDLEGITEDQVINEFKQNPGSEYPYMEYLNEEGELTDVVNTLEPGMNVSLITYAIAQNGQAIYLRDDITTTSMPAHLEEVKALEGAWTASSNKALVWNKTDNGYSPSIEDKALTREVIMAIHPERHDQVMIYGFSDVAGVETPAAPTDYVPAFAKYNQETGKLELIGGEWVGYSEEQGMYMSWASFYADSEGKFAGMMDYAGPIFYFNIGDGKITTDSHFVYDNTYEAMAMDILAFSLEDGSILSFYSMESMADQITFERSTTETAQVVSFNEFVDFSAFAKPVSSSIMNLKK